MVSKEEEVIKKRLEYMVLEMNKLLRREYGLTLKVPVSINSRLQVTEGRVAFTQSRTGQLNLKSIRIEFNKKMVLESSKDRLIGIAKHEAVHYALLLLGKPFRDGTVYFESELKRLGLPSNYDKYTKEDKDILKSRFENKVFYTAVCGKCKKSVKVWKRKPSQNVISELKKYRSSCCRSQVIYAGEIEALKVLKT